MSDWTQLSPSHESRGSAVVRSLIIHTAEGATTAASLANFLGNAANEVSYHDIADDSNSVHIVNYDQACWSTRSANLTSENFCLTGFSAWTRATWLSHTGMLERTAAWIASRAKARGIPIAKLTSADVAANKPGVFGHVNWTEGKQDGTHTDPGPQFPWDVVIARAQVLAGASPAPTPAPAPTSTKGLPLMIERPFGTGDSAMRIACPTGPKASSIVSDSWLSASIRGNGRVEAWAQVNTPGKDVPAGSGDDAHAHRDWTLHAGDRAWFELPDGTEFVSVQITGATGPGSILIEQKAA